MKQLQRSLHSDQNNEKAKRVEIVQVFNLKTSMKIHDYLNSMIFISFSANEKAFNCETICFSVAIESCDVFDRSLAHEMNASSSFIMKWMTFVVDTVNILVKLIHKYTVRFVLVDEAYSEVSNSLLNELRRMLLINDYAIEIRSELVIHDVNLLTNWQNSHDVLYHENKLYLFEIMRMNALNRNHDDSLTEHFDMKKIFELFQRKYYWSNSDRNNDFFEMRQLVRKYMKTYVVCKRSKISKHKSYKDFQFFFIFEFKWIDLIMNFVTKLSSNKNWNEVLYDFILVVVDRFTKMTHYVFVTKTISTKTLTEIFMKKIIKLHDISILIIIDRDSIFTSKFYSTLIYVLKIKHKLSTTFHAQIDDQTEKQNFSMKQYLRIYVNFEQNDWISLLFMTEFVYNNSINVFIDVSSFKVNLNFSSRMNFEKLFDFRVKSMSVKQHDIYLNKLIEIFQKVLAQTQKRQKKYVDAKMKFMKFVIENYVWLKNKNIRTKRNRKLEWKQFESFEIFDKINKQVYKLVLFKRWKIHDIFHVSLLKLVKKRKKVFE